MTTAAPPAAPMVDQLALLAKALGHPARVRILRLLLSRDACYCGQIVDELPLAQATVSQHLKVLRDAGLIVGEIDGLRVCYCASRQRLGELHELVGALIAEATEPTPMAATETVHRPAPPAAPEDAAVLSKLSMLDRFLPLWIALAMAAGLGLGSLIPSLNDGLDKLRVGTVSLPIALGLLLMMYPVLAKVRYEELGRHKHDGVSDRLFFGVSLFLSWVIGPLLMFTLAWLFLPDQPAYRTGVIIVGLARCIAMVLIWNDLAKGDRDRAALLVVFNAVFQVAAFSLLGYFYLTVLPGWLGLDTQGFEVEHLGGRAHRPDLPRHPTHRRLPHPPHRPQAQGPRLVRAAIHPPHQPDHPLRPALHDRAAVRDPGRHDHLAAARRRHDRAAAARLLRASCGWPDS